MHPYIELTRLNSPVGSLLLLWPTLAALLMASQGPQQWPLFVIFTLGTLIMRSAGCVINDYADRHVDGGVERTKNRPIPSGRVTPKEALMLFCGLVAAGGVLILFLDLQTQLLAFGGLFLPLFIPS